ncbi:MAG: response regulator [Bacillota bacterium]
MEKNILFIENDKSFYKKANEHFSNFNFKVFLRRPNQKISEFIKKKNIKMVILSNEFYKNSTYNLCKKIRELFNLSIIILSNNSNLDLILKYFKLGVDDYIVKPIKTNVLLAIVNLST